MFLLHFQGDPLSVGGEASDYNDQCNDQVCPQLKTWKTFLSTSKTKHLAFRKS